MKDILTVSQMKKMLDGFHPDEKVIVYDSKRNMQYLILNNHLRHAQSEWGACIYIEIEKKGRRKKS